MTDRQTAVGRNVTCTEARSAERSTQGDTCREELFSSTRTDKCEIDRLAGRICGQLERAASGRSAVENVCGNSEVVIRTAGTACNDTLIDEHTSVGRDLIGQRKGQIRRFELFCGRLFHFAQNIDSIFIQFTDGINIGGMERQGDHRLYLGKIDCDNAVVISDSTGCELLVFVFSAVDSEIAVGFLIGDPDGGKTGGFGRHNVDAVAEFDGQIGNAVTDEFEHAVLDKAVSKRRTDQRKCNVLRTDTVCGLARQVYRDNFGTCDIVSSLAQLLDQLRTAFADCHRTECAVTGMAVGAEDHFTAAGHHFTHIGVNDRKVCRDKVAAVLLCGRKTEDMVIFVDCTADRAKAVVAVGQDIRKREFCQTAGTCRLNDTDIGDIVGCHRIKLDFQLCRVVGGIVRGQNRPRHRVVLCFFFGGLNAHRIQCGIIGNQRFAVYQIRTAGKFFNHGSITFLYRVRNIDQCSWEWVRSSAVAARSSTSALRIFKSSSCACALVRSSARLSSTWHSSGIHVFATSGFIIS